MDNSKTKKIIAIIAAAAVCVAVIAAVIIFTRDEIIKVPEAVSAADIIESADGIIVEYGDENFVIADEAKVNLLKERFLSMGLSEKSVDLEIEGRISFTDSKRAGGEDRVVVHFDERMELIEIDGKVYYSDQLLHFKNALVTATMKKEEATTEEGEGETVTETTTKTETTKKDNTAYYSTKAVSVDWGGTKGYLEVASFCENYDTLVTSHTDHHPIVRIRSTEELNTFIDAVKDYYTLNVEKYDSEFFEDDELFIIYADENSKKADHTVERVDLEDGKMTVIITDKMPSKVDAGLESRFIFMSMEKDAIEDFSEFDAYTEF